MNFGPNALNKKLKINAYQDSSLTGIFLSVTKSVLIWAGCEGVGPPFTAHLACCSIAEAVLQEDEGGPQDSKHSVQTSLDMFG